MEGFADKVGFIWWIADLLRGDYKQSEYGKVILPLTVLRRLDCVLEPTKDAVVEKAAALAGKIDNVDPVLRRASGESFYNVSPLTFGKLRDDPENVAANLTAYIAGFPRAHWRRLPASGSTTRSSAWTKPVCCTKSSPCSPTSTCTPTWSATWRWATSSRS